MKAVTIVSYTHPTSGVTVESVTPEHFAAMQAIEDVSFPTSWPSDSFEKEVLENKVATYLVAHRGGQVLGYVGSWIILDEVHITTIAVDPALRGARVGRTLLARLLFIAIERGARWTVLEVRASNESAIRMYQHFGFRQVGKRKGYYENGEDALVLWVGSMQGRELRELVCEALGLGPEGLPPSDALSEAPREAPGPG